MAQKKIWGFILDTLLLTLNAVHFIAYIWPDHFYICTVVQSSQTIIGPLSSLAFRFIFVHFKDLSFLVVQQNDLLKISNNHACSVLIFQWFLNMPNLLSMVCWLLHNLKLSLLSDLISCHHVLIHYTICIKDVLLLFIPRLLHVCKMLSPLTSG